MSNAERRAIPINAKSVDSRDRDKMGTVAVTLNVMPNSPEVDLEKIKSEISSEANKLGIELKGIEEKPIAFGLKRLEVLLIMPDQGGTDKIEDSISKIEGVKSVESGEVTLL